MAKRFTETKIWDDTWFQELPLIYKTLWWYLFCKCDEAGVWKVNKKLAEFQLGSKISWEKIDSFLNKDKKRIEFYDEIWVLKDFVKFQYGDKILTSDHSFHKQIRKKLDTLSHRVSDRVCHTPIVIVKEKEKVIVKEKDIQIQARHALLEVIKAELPKEVKNIPLGGANRLIFPIKLENSLLLGDGQDAEIYNQLLTEVNAILERLFLGEGK